MRGFQGFDKIAPFYDGLSFLIFGNLLLKAQLEFISLSRPPCKILIVGGGTGKLLEEICKRYPEGLDIHYLDFSIKMIEKGKRKNIYKNRVCFEVENIANFKSSTESYDVILTPFFMDCFEVIAQEKIHTMLGNSLKSGGLWFFTDFHLNAFSPPWQKWLVRWMYRFFFRACGLKDCRLPDAEALFTSYKLLNGKSFLGNFILSNVYRK